MVSSVAVADPKAAVTLMDQYANDVTDRVVQNFVWHSYGTDPALAASQISRIGDEGRRDEMYRRMLDNWIERDAATAQAWIQTNPLPQSVRDRIARRQAEQPVSWEFREIPEIAVALTSAPGPSNVPPMDTMKLLLGATIALLLGALAVSWQGMNTGVKNTPPDEVARLEKQIKELRAEQDNLKMQRDLQLLRSEPIQASCHHHRPRTRGDEAPSRSKQARPRGNGTAQGSGKTRQEGRPGRGRPASNSANSKARTANSAAPA